VIAPALSVTMTTALAQSTGYVPFLRPLPVWDYWYLLLMPLCAGVAVVYKSIKCKRMSQVPKEALMIWVWILLGMAGAAAALALVVQGIAR
jgi:hypothetical protein